MKIKMEKVTKEITHYGDVRIGDVFSFKNLSSGCCREGILFLMGDEDVIELESYCVIPECDFAKEWYDITEIAMMKEEVIIYDATLIAKERV